MELLLQNGDYVPNGDGGFTRVTGGEALLQRVLFGLSARRGGFPMLPNLGSRLYLLLRAKPSERNALARQYVAEALAEETELSVTDVAISEAEGLMTVTVDINYRGDSLSVGIEI
jgi:phage gp46-like protein